MPNMFENVERVQNEVDILKLIEEKLRLINNNEIDTTPLLDHIARKENMLLKP